MCIYVIYILLYTNAAAPTYCATLAKFNNCTMGYGDMRRSVYHIPKFILYQTCVGAYANTANYNAPTISLAGGTHGALLIGKGEAFAYGEYVRV